MINVERKYKISNIKNAINLFENQYLAFSQIGWPNTKKDMDGKFQSQGFKGIAWKTLDKELKKVNKKT